MRFLGFTLLGTILFFGCILETKADGPAVIIPEGYKLVWSDEFDQNGVPQDAYWSYEIGFVRNKELQWYQPQNAIVKDGMLVIEGKRERIKNDSYEAESKDWRKNRKYADYSSACIHSRNKFSFQYGIMEVKARIDTSCGSWPAIWTLGVDRRWPSNGEVDIMEFYLINNIQSILANAAWGKDKHSWNANWNSKRRSLNYFLEKDALWPEKFHIWKMVWTHDDIKLFLDDELLNEIDINKITYESGFNPFRQPHYILINLAIGSNGGDPSKSSFPIYYEVDYVRVFQKE
ncbi:glycoside hydrolase family 16 protein [Thermophagus sp. OGC60D27]|uniref:glycoside hydrolase family 16 protein n=1 Tax=Thermophagus sp. OGC60D27 TaxID=3458415 RepID=UPI004037ED3F